MSKPMMKGSMSQFIVRVVKPKVDLRTKKEIVGGRQKVKMKVV